MGNKITEGCKKGRYFTFQANHAKKGRSSEPRELLLSVILILLLLCGSNLVSFYI